MGGSRIQRIVFPTDFSAEASGALRVAAAFCKRHDAELNVLHVIEVQNHEDSTELLNQLEKKLVNDYGIRVSTHVSRGIAFTEICSFLADEKIDLVIMGSHGAGGVKEFFIGNTAYNVIKNSPVTVLTIPPNFEGEFNRVLFSSKPVNGILEKFELLQPLENQPGFTMHIAELQSAGELLALSHELAVDLIAINATLVLKQDRCFIDPFTRQIVNHARVPVLSYRNGTKLA